MDKQIRYVGEYNSNVRSFVIFVSPLQRVMQINQQP